MKTDSLKLKKEGKFCVFEELFGKFDIKHQCELSILICNLVGCYPHLTLDWLPLLGKSNYSINDWDAIDNQWDAIENRWLLPIKGWVIEQLTHCV